MTLVILLNFLFSLGFIITKASYAYIPPCMVIGLRMTLGGLLLMLFQFFSRSGSSIHRKRASHATIWYPSLLFVVVCVCNIYLTNVLEAWGLQTVPAAKAALIYSFSPFIAALVEFVFFNQRMNKGKWAGMVVGFVGLIMVLMPTYAQEIPSTNLLFISLPEAAIMGAALATALGWIAVRELIKCHYSVSYINGTTMLVGGVLSLATSLVIEPLSVDLIKHIVCMPAFWGYTIAGIVIYCLVCYNLYAHLLRLYTATFMSLTGFLMPLFTALLGWAWLGEKVSGLFFVSLLLIFSGVFLFYKNEHPS